MKSFRCFISESVVKFPTHNDAVVIPQTDLNRHPPKKGQSFNIGDEVSQLAENSEGIFFHYGKVVHHDDKNALIQWEDNTFSMHSRSGGHLRWHKHASGRDLRIRDRIDIPKKIKTSKATHQLENESYINHNRSGVVNVAVKHLHNILSRSGLQTNEPENFRVFHRISVLNQNHELIHKALINNGFERRRNSRSSFDHQYIKHVDGVPFIVEFKNNNLLSKQRSQTTEDAVKSLYIPDYPRSNPSKVPGWINNSVDVYIHRAGFKYSKAQNNGDTE